MGGPSSHAQRRDGQPALIVRRAWGRGGAMLAARLTDKACGDRTHGSKPEELWLPLGQKAQANKPRQHEAAHKALLRI
jgi:hypothetical protein